MNLTWEACAAIYAAIVATGALFLEVRRWFESGPSLRLKLMTEASLLSGGMKDPRDFLFLWVTNTGAAPTTITHMVLLQYGNFIKRWRDRPYASAFVPMPQITGGPGLPALLEPGAIWTGAAEYDDGLREMVNSGHLYVGVACSHSDRNFLRKVPVKRAQEP